MPGSDYFPSLTGPNEHWQGKSSGVPPRTMFSCLLAFLKAMPTADDGPEICEYGMHLEACCQRRIQTLCLSMHTRCTGVLQAEAWSARGDRVKTPFPELQACCAGLLDARK